jgi:hypothetical protein
MKHFDRGKTVLDLSSKDEASLETIHTPPRVPLTLRIGVTGHRPDPSKRAEPDIPTARAEVAQVLKIIRDAVSDVADVSANLFATVIQGGSKKVDRRLRVISALASGVDQWVADEGVKLGFELHCPLPFARDEYRKDFAVPEDAAEFDRLLSLATAVMELDGRVESVHGIRQPDSHSYEAVGRAVLNQTDLLIAIWDEKPSHGFGGTGSVVREALGRGIPVIVIPWESPTTWKIFGEIKSGFLNGDTVLTDEMRLRNLVRELVLPPADAEKKKGREEARETYFSERRKWGRPLLGTWTLFQRVICGEFSRSSTWKELATLGWFRVPDFLESTRAQYVHEWVEKQPVQRRDKNIHPDSPQHKLNSRAKEGPQMMEHPVPVEMQRWADKGYLKHYAWANGLSIYYGSIYRSAFLVNFVLGAIAVFLALVCIGMDVTGRAQIVWITAELGVITGIVVLTTLGWRRDWHRRWIDYRMLAERLRVARCASLFGGGGPQMVHAGHQSTYGNPLHTWMHWHYRAIERAVGLPDILFRKGYLESCQEFWKESFINDQQDYHHRTGERFGVLNTRLHLASTALFIATLVACAFHVLHFFIESESAFAWLPHRFTGWLTVLSAFLPAVGAALAAIRSQAETQRVTQRSLAMEAELENIGKTLSAIPVESSYLTSVPLRECLDRVSALMIREMLDWRVVFLDRPLELPV